MSEILKTTEKFEITPEFKDSIVKLLNNIYELTLKMSESQKNTFLFHELKIFWSKYQEIINDLILIISSLKKDFRDELWQSEVFDNFFFNELTNLKNWELLSVRILNKNMKQWFDENMTHTYLCAYRKFFWLIEWKADELVKIGSTGVKSVLDWEVEYWDEFHFPQEDWNLVFPEIKDYYDDLDSLMKRLEERNEKWWDNLNEDMIMNLIIDYNQANMDSDMKTIELIIQIKKLLNQDELEILKWISEDAWSNLHEK